MQTAGHGNHASSGTMETQKYMPLSLIMIDFKMVNTNVFLNIMKPICARIYENKSPVFLICTYTHTHTHTHRLDHINLFTPKIFPKLENKHSVVIFQKLIVLS
jgi:hypothetical protein